MIGNDKFTRTAKVKLAVLDEFESRITDALLGTTYAENAMYNLIEKMREEIKSGRKNNTATKIRNR